MREEAHTNGKDKKKRRRDGRKERNALTEGKKVRLRACVLCVRVSAHRQKESIKSDVLDKLEKTVATEKGLGFFNFFFVFLSFFLL